MNNLNTDQENIKHPINDLNKNRSTNSEYSSLFPMLRNYPDKFLEYTRMTVSTFNYILSKVDVLLTKNRCNLHTQPILPEEQLILTLRFLATGSTYSHLSISFKMGIKTVSVIVQKTLNVLWSSLGPEHMAIPSTEEFIKISQDFEKKWGFPHCIGAIDGRHVAIQRPNKSNSLYFNYKSYFSIVLQAVVDSNYRYIFIDVGGYGRQHDSTTYKASQLYAALMTNKIHIPRASTIANTNLFVPYYFVGDGAYPLSDFIMTPYPGTNLLTQEKIFNKQLSRARAVVENAFGQTSQKWRILYTTINKTPETVNSIIKCTCLLHNIIIDLERKINVHISNEEHGAPNCDIDDVLIAPETRKDIRNELANYFIKKKLVQN